MANIVIFGTGDVAKLAHYYFTHDSDHTVVAFALDAHFRKADSFLDLPLVDFETLAQKYPPENYLMFVALGYAGVNKIRSTVYHKTKDAGYTLATYVSSHCTCFDRGAIGENCFVLENNVLQPFSSIGNDVFLWSSNVVGHETRIDDHCFVAGHSVIASHCHVGTRSFLGLNCTIRNGVRVAPETVVGAGAIVMKDTIEKGVYLPPRSMLFQKRSDEIEI
jgi:sugar O-acyltransferase (sialic acid O-acetyltransferase NeuD family)